MPLPPWTIELIRRGISDVARKASEPETLEKLKKQATEILQDLPETAARGVDAVMRTAEAGKQSVEKWSRKQTAIAVPMLNASGVLLHPLGTGVPLSDATLQAGFELMKGDCMASDPDDSRLHRKLERLLPDGDFDIAIASSFPAALTAFSQLVQSRPLVIHRSHAVRLPNGKPLPEAFGTLLPVIQEVGSVGSVSVSDYDGLDSFCSIVADVGSEPAMIQDFGSRDAWQAVVLPVATVSTSVHEMIPSAESLLSQGADFVLMPGDGICGGPACGLLIGRREPLSVITQAPAWSSLAASDALQAMMLAALDGDASPIHLLLDTNEENLHSRATRMSTRLSASDNVEQCDVTEASANITDGGRWKIPSRQLRLRHASQDAESWAANLREDLPAIIVGVEGKEIVVDLRWIDAAQDNSLATAIE